MHIDGALENSKKSNQLFPPHEPVLPLHYQGTFMTQSTYSLFTQRAEKHLQNSFVF